MFVALLNDNLILAFDNAIRPRARALTAHRSFAKLAVEPPYSNADNGGHHENDACQHNECHETDNDGRCDDEGPYDDDKCIR